MIELDYLAIGHVTRDLVEGGFTIGGTVAYAARTAQSLGCRVGILTSAASDLDLDRDLDDIAITRIPAAATTTFENINMPKGRRQRLHATAQTLLPEMIPPDWKLSDRGIIHLGPVAQECSPTLIDAFENTFIGLTPQGWMRRRDQAGWVSRCKWQDAQPALARANAVILSDEDVASDQALIDYYVTQSRLLVLTLGAAGCKVYTSSQSRRFPAPTKPEQDATGSGDIFAAAFFVHLQQNNDPWLAAQFANCIAAQSVTRQGLASTPEPEEIAHCKNL